MTNDHRASQRSQLNSEAMLDVDWKNPSVQRLMSQINGVELDNRTSATRRMAKWRYGWSENDTLWEKAVILDARTRENDIILFVSEAINPLERITVDPCLYAPGTRVPKMVYGRVIECVQGRRPSDPQDAWVIRVKQAS